MRALNDDVTKFLRRPPADDVRVGTGSHFAEVLSAGLVRLLVDWSLRRGVVIGQSDHKEVQTRCYIPEQTNGRTSYLRPVLVFRNNFFSLTPFTR